eukprot:403344719
MNNSRLMIVNQQTQPKSLQDLSQMTQNNKLQDKQKVSKIFLPQLKPKKTLRNIMHSNGRPNIGISQDTSKLSMLDQSSLNNTLAFPSHDISKYSSYNPQASQQQLKTQNSPSKMLLYKSSSQYRIAPMSDKHILEKKMELYTSLERRKQFFESYIKFNPNQPEMRRNLSSLNGLKQTQQEIILETAFQNNQKQDGRHDSPLKSKNMMSQLQSYKRGISSLNKDLVILQQQQTQNDAMNNGKVQPFSPLNSQYPFKPVITESNFLKNHHHSNKQSIDFNRDYQNQGVNNVNQTNLLPKVSSHRQLMPLGQFQQNNQNMMEQSAYLSQNHLTQLQNSQNLSTDNQSPNQTLIQQKLKRKKKKGDLDSISSFDSELEENRKDAHLMITKKNRKDLEGFNDRMWEKSLEMEKVMDLIIKIKFSALTAVGAIISLKILISQIVKHTKTQSIKYRIMINSKMLR